MPRKLRFEIWYRQSGSTEIYMLLIGKKYMLFTKNGILIKPTMNYATAETFLEMGYKQIE